jgi:peptide/nickel transport system substrate-binding protein
MIPRRRPDAPLRRLDSRVSRRGLLGAGVLAGVLAASGIPLQARSRGGLLRLGLAGGLPGRDWTEASPVLAQGAVYETLTEIGPTGELRGELALSWETEPGALRWHITLRPLARFHEGRLLDSSDVLASLERHRRGPSAWALAQVERMEVQGPRALLVTLTEGDPDFPLLLADPALIIGPGGRFDGIGTGPYRVAPAEGPARLRLERLGDHWTDGRAGWFEALEAVRLPEPQARLDALLAGEVDAVSPLPPRALAEAREAGLVVAAVQGNRQLHVQPPRRDRARLWPLMPRAVNREELAAAWGGLPAADHPLGPLHPSLATLTPPPFDPAAREAMGEAAPRFSQWEGCATEGATFRKALAGPWAAIRRHPGLIRYLAAARLAEGPERAMYYAAAQQICAQSGVAVAAAHIPALTVHRTGLAHEAAVSPLAPLDGARLPKRWWFA